MVTVAHRLESLIGYDRVIVMESGKIKSVVEDGPDLVRRIEEAMDA